MILSTLATERVAFLYLLATIFTALFGGVYEVFSHGVWSGWMVYAFAFPLVLGVLPFSWMTLRRKPVSCIWCCRLHHAAVMSLTVGSVMQGVLAIYGTTNRLTIIYWITGGVLLVLAQIIRLLRK